MIRRLGRRSIRLALGNERVRRVVESELRPHRPTPPKKASPQINEALVGRTFVDRHGVSYELDPALRDRLKPQWRTMCDPVAVAAPPPDTVLADRARKAETSVREALALVSSAAEVELGGRVLEVGCYDGSVGYQLATLARAHVTGSDLARYYVVQRPGEPSEEAIQRQQADLAALRARARVVAGVSPGLVDFVEDDITDSRLHADTFDVVLSFEVLEHVADPAAAFAGMARVLRPGGIGYHDYNPFFAINGGHSLCTLDFAWGHARLDADDFDRYLCEIRPAERDQALRFYADNLNRMTLADLRTAIDAAGLEIVALVPWFDRSWLRSLTPDVIATVVRVYPTARVEDLLATFVAVVVRRPARA